MRQRDRASDIMDNRMNNSTIQIGHRTLPCHSAYFIIANYVYAFYLEETLGGLSVGVSITTCQ